MRDERFGQVSRLFLAAGALDPAAGVRFLKAECGGDESLRSEVESLLGQSDDSSPAPAPAADSAAKPETMIGRQIANYRVQALIGAGGMGEVYRGRDLKLGRDVAIKVLRSEVIDEPERLAAFRAGSSCPGRAQSSQYRDDPRDRRDGWRPRHRDGVDRRRNAGRTD